MPKSGFSANSQAKVAANAIRGELTGSRVFEPRFANTCWSLVATNDGIKVGANYKAALKKLMLWISLFHKVVRAQMCVKPYEGQKVGIKGLQAICSLSLITNYKRAAEWLPFL